MVSTSVSERAATSILEIWMAADTGSIPGLSQRKEKDLPVAGLFLFLLRGPESNRGLEVMSLPRYLSSTPLYVFYLRYTSLHMSPFVVEPQKIKVGRLYAIYMKYANRYGT